ncbi:hypothetical protein [Lysobacter gummosus]|uniref:hypothetical protein n=1 Tax=Lysobacter gummosus TaxID=262324 RepID=UPI00363CDC8E
MGRRKQRFRWVVDASETCCRMRGPQFGLSSCGARKTAVSTRWLTSRKHAVRCAAR